MFFVVAATISGGMTAGAWTLQYGLGWACVFGILAATASGAQAMLVLGAIERREERERVATARESGLPATPSRLPRDPA
ncbi:hypothetical protein [Methylobacterium platani]|uniref:Uncharacterized protein n=2 Tax=Methylobacterium platani TaxID=427683 RepID=A0A179S5M7_9HYPH|nr:hypothetical protein [Methylobacterium platani]KMO15930.1 hypothetical protein SQ03_15985 [Methylobacterium platani JCM 14648]OAS22446.1 hypothetical protein A5481_18775 [Methylobacterium platani]